MYQYNIVEFIKLMKSNDISNLDKKQLLEEFLENSGIKPYYLIDELHSFNICSEIYLPVVIDKCTPFNFPNLLEVINKLNIDYTQHLPIIIDKCSPIHTCKLVQTLNNSKIDYYKHLSSIINKCSPDNIYRLVDSLKNNSSIDLFPHLLPIINRCEQNYIHLLVDSLNISNLDYSVHLSSIINRCSPDTIYKLVNSLNISNTEYSQHLSSIINRCDSNYMHVLVSSLNHSNIEYSNYLSSIINRCHSNNICSLVNSLNNSNVDYSHYLSSIIDKCNAYNIYELVDSLRNSGLNYSEYLSPIINKCPPNHMYILVDYLNKSNRNYSNYLSSIINNCSPGTVHKLIDSLNKSNLDYSEHLLSIINKCNTDNICKLISTLNASNLNYSNLLLPIINKSNSDVICELIDSLNASNLDYSQHLLPIINKCTAHEIDKLMDSLNKPNINFKKLLSPVFFDKIANVKTMQRLTANVLFGVNTPNLISQISFILENIKDPSLSNIERKKIIYINNLIKKLYTTENKKELYNIFNLSSQIQTSYVDLVTNITEKIVDNFYTENLDIDIHTHKKVLNSKLDKDIRLGVEIETAGLSKNKISSLQLNNFSYQLDNSISNYNKRTNSIYSNGRNTAEVVSKKIDPYNETDISNIYTTCETLRKNCATTNFTCGLHVHVSGEGISKDNPKILDNFLSDMIFMQEILIKKLTIYSSRINQHTQLIPSDFSGKSLDFIKYCNRNEWPDKYYMLNLLSLDKYNTVEFRLFNLPDSIDANVILAYADMATSMVNSVRKKGSFCSLMKDIYNFKNIDVNDNKLVDFVYDKFLDYIHISKDTKNILTNTDKIFSFYKAKEVQIPELTKQHIDFHTPKNKTLQTPVTKINIGENKYHVENSLYYDTLYSIEKRTLSTSKNLKPVYFYPYKEINKTDKKQLVKSNKNHVFYPKPTEKDPYCLVL